MSFLVGFVVVVVSFLFFSFFFSFFQDGVFVMV